MFRTGIAAGVVVIGLALFAVDQGFSQQDKAPAPAVKGKLPKNFSKLGLTDEQKQKIFAIEADFTAKIDVLKKQIKGLQAQQTTEVHSVLTDDQKTMLRRLALQAIPGGGSPPEAKKEGK